MKRVQPDGTREQPRWLGFQGYRVLPSSPKFSIKCKFTLATSLSCKTSKPVGTWGCLRDLLNVKVGAGQGSTVIRNLEVNPCVMLYLSEKGNHSSLDQSHYTDGRLTAPPPQKLNIVSSNNTIRYLVDRREHLRVSKLRSCLACWIYAILLLVRALAIMLSRTLLQYFILHAWHISWFNRSNYYK